MKKPSMYDIPADIFERNKAVFEELLGNRYYEIVRLRTEADLSMKEIGELYGVTPERIRQIIGRSYERIKEARYL